MSGGAVPGGRGIGIIDLEQEETRDAEYRARAHGDALGLSRMSHEAVANATTVEGVSMALSNVDVLAESRARPRSRAGSVKRTPSSARAKRGSISVTGAFVDHVIELPADEDEDVGGQRRTPANGGQRAQSGSVSRATPRNGSRPSTAREVVVHRSGGSSKDGHGKEKEKGKGKGKPQIRPTEEAEEEEDAPRPAHPPKSRLVQRKPDVQAAKTDDDEVVEKKAPAGTSESRGRRATKVITIGSDSDPPEGAVEGSETSVPPRRSMGMGSMTPVKSAMKPRPRSNSQSRPRSVLGGESEEEVRAAATASGAAGKRQEEVAKSTRNSGAAVKEKEKEQASEGRKVTKKATPRPRSPTHSPTPISPKTKNARAPRRRLSVVVPSVSKEYFSSQGAREVEPDDDHERETGERGTNLTTTSGARRKLSPAASMHAVAAEASTSTTKRGKPSPAKASAPITVSGKSKPQAQAKAKPKPSASKEKAKAGANDSEDAGEDDRSMIIDAPVTSTSRGGPRRSAANKATTRLREEVAPDMMNFEKEQKQAKRRRSEGGQSTVSLREVEKEERSGKKRKVAAEVEEVEEEAEVEDVVLVPSVKAKSRASVGKGKVKVTSTVGSDDDDDDMDNPPTKNKPSGSQEKKGGRGRGKALAAVRLMTTSVSLLDDVIKVRLILSNA